MTFRFNIFRNARIAVTYMYKKPLRTFLVLQGIIWAVAIAIFPQAMREGSVRIAQRNPAEYSLDTVTFQVESSSGNLFTYDDIEAIKKSFKKKEVSGVMPAKVISGEMGTGGASAAAEFIGTDENSPYVRTFVHEKGRYLTADDVKKKSKVCVLEVKVAEKFFGRSDPIGKTINIKIPGSELTLMVIGVMEKRSELRLSTNELGFRYRTKQKISSKISFMLGLDPYSAEWKRTETAVHVPISILPGEGFEWIMIKTEPTIANKIAEGVQAFLLNRGKDCKAYSNIVFPVIFENRLKIREQLTKAIFAICLILGGVMIMNIMLLSVMERYNEIAIRRVEGANKMDIAVQFITEGAVLCFIATFFGVPLGLLMAFITSKAEPWAIASVGIPFKQLPWCVLWTVAIGILSGIIPARKAASLDPAEILRQK